MRNKLIQLCLLSVISLFSVNAQEKKIEKANKSFFDNNYSKAINQYEAIVANGNASSEVFQNLADANYLNANYQDAAQWYKKLAGLGSHAIDQEHIYRYAVSLRTIEQYEKSDQWINILNDLNHDDLRVQNFLKNKDYMKKIKERLGSYTIENLDINSSGSDFSPSFYNKGIVFSTARDTNVISKNVHSWNKKGFLDLYTASVTKDGVFSEISPFSASLNSKLHESSTAFTKDGKTVYFTRNNGINGSFKRDKDGVSRLQIYRATLIGGKWTNLESMPFNADHYSVAHPTLNKNEDKLYFSSDMPGTNGQSDIWVATISPSGILGEPENLGTKINTESKETFPFITDDDLFYFASDGHPGLGGMDIFATDLKDLENSEIVNLGEPINSIYDDFSLVINNDLKKGFFASNRIDGKGGDDIYSFTELEPIDFECSKYITGIVKDKKTGATLANAKVMLYNPLSQKVDQTNSENDGGFTLKGKCTDGDFLIVGEKFDYEKDMVTFDNKSNATIKNLELALPKIEKIVEIEKAAPIGTDLAKFLDLKHIYFDFDKSNIRADARLILEKVRDYMIQYPTVRIDVRSHTDSRGNDSYNLALSKRRAKSTIEYLVAQGIDASRIIGDGYGETKLINNCNNSTKCSKINHQLNRRSEFIIIK